ncbi:MAG: thiamine ABC transporter substrate binding subunit [Gammaproteobacteria bacterium]|nr:thiamine ABC transporter substrate binding subunit [Gammaproteobacteria bacterium]
MSRITQVLITVFCLLQLTNASAGKQTLTIYTYDSFTSDWGPGPQVKKAFEEQCDCILEFVGLEDGVALLSRLKLEATNTKADLILGIDTNLTAEARATGLIEPHQISTGPTTLPTDWKDTYFLPYDYGYFAFVYNKEILPNPPTSLKELVESTDAPEILIQDPRTSTPGLGFLLWMKKVYGDEAHKAWVKLSKRVVTVSKGWSEAYGLFLKGEAPMVLSYTTSPAYHIIAEEDKRFAAASFEEGHYQQIEVAGLIASSKKKALGREFLTFMMSEKFQSIIPTTNWMYPAALEQDQLPAAFKDLVKPGHTLLFKDTDIAKNRKQWISEWLEAMAE